MLLCSQNVFDVINSKATVYSEEILWNVIKHMIVLSYKIRTVCTYMVVLLI